MIDNIIGSVPKGLIEVNNSASPLSFSSEFLPTTS